MSTDSNTDIEITHEEFFNLIDGAIEELEFISLIPTGYKPNWHTYSYIKRDAWFVTLRRRWSGERGEIGKNKVEQLLKTCDTIHTLCVDINSSALLPMSESEYLALEEKVTELIHALRDSQDGFVRIAETYVGNVEKLDKLLETEEDVPYSTKQDIAISYYKASKEIVLLAQNLEDWLYTYLVYENTVAAKKTLLINATDTSHSSWSYEDLNTETQRLEALETIDYPTYQESLFDKGFNIITQTLFGDASHHYNDEYYYSSSLSESSDSYEEKEKEEPYRFLMSDDIIRSIKSSSPQNFFDNRMDCKF